MTVDDRITIDFADLLALQIECSKCHTIVSAPPERFNAFLYNCPGCNNELWEREDLEHKLLQRLASAMKGMRELSKDAAFQVRLQIAHPS